MVDDKDLKTEFLRMSSVMLWNHLLGLCMRRMKEENVKK